MGEVRSKVEAKDKDAPLPRLKDMKEELYDLLAIKLKDLQTEGDVTRARNEKSIANLNQAVQGVSIAITALEGY